MISLHQVRTSAGEVSVTLHKADGSVSYRKQGVTQTWMDARGRNLAPHIDKAVALFASERAHRVLVLGHGGGMAARLLHQRGMHVVSVDHDACAESLGKLFFRAPPALRVVVEDAARYVAGAANNSLDGVLVDFQDDDQTPSAYLDPRFWGDVVRVMRPGGLVVVALPRPLHGGADWPRVQQALAAARLDAVAVTAELGPGWRLLATVAD